MLTKAETRIYLEQETQTLTPGQSPDKGFKASPLLPCLLMGNPITSLLSPGQGETPSPDADPRAVVAISICSNLSSDPWGRSHAGNLWNPAPFPLVCHSWSVLIISFTLKYNPFYLHSLYYWWNKQRIFEFSLQKKKKKYISVFHITVPQFNCARLDFASEGTICTHRFLPSGIFFCFIA